MLLPVLLCLRLLSEVKDSAASDPLIDIQDIKQQSTFNDMIHSSSIMIHFDFQTSGRLADFQFFWSHGDGTWDWNMTMQWHYHTHNYRRRGVYDASVRAQSKVDDTFAYDNYTIRFGNVQFTQCYPIVMTENSTYTLRYEYLDELSTLQSVTDQVNTSSITKPMTVMGEDFTNPCGAIGRDYNTSDTYISLRVVKSDNVQKFIPHSDIIFQIDDLANASQVFDACKVDFGDISHSNEYIIPSNEAFEPSWAHTYLKTGMYLTKAYCWNSVNFTESKTLAVEVVTSLSGLSLVTNNPVKDLTDEDPVKLKLVMMPDDVPGIFDTSISIDWGDGSTNNSQAAYLVDGENDIPNGTHRYLLPGSFHITVTAGEGNWVSTFLQNVSESMNIQFDVMPINNQSFIVSEEALTLNMTNLPTYDISYTLDFGEESIAPKSYEAKGATDLFKPFHSEIVISYPWGGNYTINLTASNDYFNYTLLQVVNVPQGVPKSAWSLKQSGNDAVIVEESSVSFEFFYTIDIASTPTVVVECYLNFGDGTLTSKSDIQFPLVKSLPWPSHVYPQTTDINVTLACENQFTAHNLSLNLTVRNYTQLDYKLEYDEALGVNGTILTQNKENVDFKFNLFDMINVLQHSVEIDFGDGSPILNMRLMAWNFPHLYSERGVYNGQVEAFTPKGNFTYTFTIYIGVSELTIDRTASLPNTNIRLLLEEKRKSRSQTLIKYGDGKYDNNDCNPTCTFIHAYSSPGMYNIITTLTVGDIVETLTYKEAVFIDNPVSNLTLTLLVKKINQPPGKVQFDIKLNPFFGKSIWYLECKIDLGDQLDRRIHTLKQGSFNPGQTITFKGRYVSMGNQYISVNCSNRMGYQILQESATVGSICFGGNGIFDEDYADPKTPLLIMASSEVEVTSRAILLCNQNPIYFTWSLSILNNTDFDLLEYVPITQPNKDSFRIQKGMLEPNLHSLEVNVSTFYQGDVHWLYGLTYVHIIGSPLIVQFKGGSIRATGNANARINVRSLSFDPDNAENNKDEFVFKWMCKSYATADVAELEVAITNPFAGITFPCNNISSEIKPGIRQFEKEKLPDKPFGYEFSVGARLRTKTSLEDAVTYVQYTKGAPEIEIECLFNCEIKVARSSALVMEAVCSYCFEAEFYVAVLNWTLVEMGPGEATKEVSNLKEITDVLDDNPASIVIKKNDLKSCQKYRLKVVVDMSTREALGVSYTDFMVNCAPWKGTCQTTPSKGEARSTNFRTTCRNWVDDGYNLKGKVEPSAFIYKFYISKGRNILPLFQGAQAMTPEEPLPIIPGTKGGDYIIICRVYDALNDYAEFNTTVRLTVPELHSLDEVGANVDQAEFTSGMAKETSVLSKQLVQTTFTASILQTIEVASVNKFVAEFDENANNDGSAVKNRTFLDVWEKFASQSQDKEMKEEITKKYQTFINQLSEKSQNLSELNGHGLEAYAETLATVMYSEDTLDMELSEQGNDLINTGTAYLESLSTKEPFPIKDKLDDVVFAMTGALDRIYTKNTPSYKTSDSEVNVQAEGVGEEEKHMFSFFIMQEQTAIDEVKINKSKNVVPNVENSTNTLLSVMLKDQVKGQPSKVIERDGIQLTARKVTARTLKDSGFEAEKFAMSFPMAQNSSWNSTSTINLKASVTKKNLYSYSEDKSSYDITSPVLSLRIDDENGTSQFDGQLSLKIKRPMPEFKTYLLNETKLGEEGFCHHQIQIKKASETTFIYVITGVKGPQINAFIRHGQPPVSYANDVKRIEGEYVEFNAGSNRKKRATSVAAKFTLNPGDLSEGLVFMGIDFGEMGESLIEYSFLAYSDSCRVWDREKNIWSNSSCKISPYSSPEETICDCQDAPGHNFASSFYVPPNLINFDLVFGKFDAENAAVYGTLIGLFVAFGLAAVWAKRKGRRDKHRWGVGYLCDNLIGDTYFYLITVHTGLTGNSGTESRVSFIITGEAGDTGVRLLEDGKRHLETGTVMSFIMATHQSLGDLKLLRLWHDNSGKGQNQSWYLSKVFVEDLQVNTRYAFICEEWLALDKSDGLIDRLLPEPNYPGQDEQQQTSLNGNNASPHNVHTVKCPHKPQNISSFAGRIRSYLEALTCNEGYKTWIHSSCQMSFEDDLMSFSKLFSAHSRINLSDTHLWLSILLRPEKSMFTRVQRVATCLATLLLAMISSALFYQPEDAEGNSSNNPGSEVQLGTLRFSMTTLYTSVIGLVVTIPPIVLIVYLFKSRRPWVSCKTSCCCCRSRAKLSKDSDSDIKATIETCSTPGSCADEDPLSAKYDKNVLPPWCLIVAWVILITTILICSFSLILYSMQWGKTVSEEWLASFVLSFFESIFIMDPIKVILLSTLFAMLTRNPQGSPDSNSISLDIVKQQARKYGCTELDPSILPPDPLPPKLLADTRKRREEESQANNVFMELILYVFFIFCIFSVSYGNRDARSFNLNEHIQTHLVKPPFRKARNYYGTQSEPLTWSKLRVLNDVYYWLNVTMQETMFPWYGVNGDVLPWTHRLFMKDLSNYRVGPVRVRQARMPRGKPSAIKDDPSFTGPLITHQDNLVGTTERSPAYDINGEETGEYCLQWKQSPCSDAEKQEAFTSSAWVFRSTREEQSFPVIGKFAIYSGAAYIMDLRFNKYIITQFILNELAKNSWLDIQTRAVFVEFTLYNANVNLLTSVRLAAEIPEYGGIITWADVKPMRIYDHFGGLGVYIMLCQIISSIVTIMFAVKAFKKVYRQRCLFFLEMWNIFDLFIVLLCFIALIVYIIRKVLVIKAMDKFRNEPKIFVNFYEATMCDDIFGWLLATVVFLCTLRVMRILGYNQRILMIASVLKRAGPGLFSFSLLFGIIISAFMSAGFALFHGNLKSFMTLWESYVTIVYLLMGKNVFKKMVLVSAILSRIYFFLLAVLVVFVFLTIFQAILNFTITEVHSDVSNAPTPYGIMNILHKMYATVILDNSAVEFIKRISASKTDDKDTTPDNKVLDENATQVHKVFATLRDQFYIHMERAKRQNMEDNKASMMPKESPGKKYYSEDDVINARKLRKTKQDEGGADLDIPEIGSEEVLPCDDVDTHSVASGATYIPDDDELPKSLTASQLSLVACMDIKK